MGNGLREEEGEDEHRWYERNGNYRRWKGSNRDRAGTRRNKRPGEMRINQKQVYTIWEATTL